MCSGDPPATGGGKVCTPGGSGGSPGGSGPGSGSGSGSGSGGAATKTVTVTKTVLTQPTEVWEEIEIFPTKGAPKPSSTHWEHIKLFTKKPWKRSIKKDE
jgi:hypothetical protein